MQIVTEKISKRNSVFCYPLPEWDLYLHLIEADTNNYLIDTGLGSQSVAPILDYLKSVDNQKPVVIINTHHHWDHIWGNGAISNCKIIAHTLCKTLSDNLWCQMYEENTAYHAYGCAQKVLPNQTFEQELYFEQDKIRLFYTPGHTIDGISILDEEDGVLNVGDNIGDENKPLIPELDCKRSVYQTTLEQYLTLNINYCVSGHRKVEKGDIWKHVYAEFLENIAPF